MVSIGVTVHRLQGASCVCEFPCSQTRLSLDADLFLCIGLPCMNVSVIKV